MKTKKSIYLFMIPGGLLFLVFFAVPTIYGLSLSFTNWDGLSNGFKWVGFSNYVNLFTNDTTFHQAVGNTLKFVVSVVIIQSFFSLVFALILLRNTKVNVFLRTLYFFPTILASVSVAFIWTFIYDPNIGILNAVLKIVGLGHLAHAWIGDPTMVIYSLAMAEIWAHTGQLLIIYLAGLQQIPVEMNEVARIEGASRWQIFWKVTWPLLTPATTIVVAYTTIQSFRAFDLVYAMTNGGPGSSSEILATYIYHQAFQYNHVGYASAVAMIFMVVIAIITMLQFGILRFRKSA
ncbi:carbohydrate ABC transporter permease [Alicyclobacillus dauci]|uniref:Sugar ABC transporter permease n=1 Tax=Alicyclobacillus dauci TaxID=1475485 RepID=A0ABY6Z7Y3_9BACL|nr:sugar ABC transporter permease [Alicyclobacillus dauci]WAH38376.1 sugar ABC transporter permease [Alicyclobacillus dauci]